jgi:hypothetical protein
MAITERRVAEVVVLSIRGDITINGGGKLLLAEKIREMPLPALAATQG